MPLAAATTEPPSASSLRPSQLLAEKAGGLRRRHVFVQAMTGVSIAVVLGVELLALAMFLDWWIELPWAIRLISLLVQAGLIATILILFVFRPLLRQPDN